MDGLFAIKVKGFIKTDVLRVRQMDGLMDGLFGVKVNGFIKTYGWTDERKDGLMDKRMDCLDR